MISEKSTRERSIENVAHNRRRAETIPEEQRVEGEGLWNRILSTVYEEAADFVEQEVTIAKEKVATSAKTAVRDAIPLVMAAVAVLVALLLLLVGIGAAVGVLFTHAGLSPLGSAAAGMLSTAVIITVVAIFTIKWALRKMNSRDYAPGIEPGETNEY